MQRQRLPSQTFSGPQSSISRHYHEITGDSKRLRGLCDSGVGRNLQPLRASGYFITHLGIGNKVEEKTVAIVKKMEERKDEMLRGNLAVFLMEI